MVSSKEATLQGGMGENTPFAKQSRKKERDNGHNTGQNIQIRYPIDPFEDMLIGEK